MIFFFFVLSVGGVTTILTTELFTQTTRSAAYIIAGSVNWLSFFFISMVFPFIVVSRENNVSSLRISSFYCVSWYFPKRSSCALFVLFSQIGLRHYCFLVFLAVSSLVSIYIFLVVPETKNKSFLEIQDEFKSKNRRSSRADGSGTTLLQTSIWTESQCDWWVTFFYNGALTQFQCYSW